MQKVLTPVKVIINEKTLKFELGDDTIVYYDDVNAFMENTGLTIQNVELTQLKAYYLKFIQELTFLTLKSMRKILKNSYKPLKPLLLHSVVLTWKTSKHRNVLRLSAA